ncbi:right-handed parallel beta-helix repeat-containing protein, partial [Bacteroidales bacterium OttesenSCG-928-I21]|nr:right-handed parallel beta-helix repeat-containing protein [Bacteroidales bacterium OttesenSCG-928-I21]
DKDAYKELLITLKNNMQQDAMESYGQSEKPLFITYQVGAQYTSGIQLNIGMAQLEASNEHSDIICAGPIYPMTDVGGHLDGNGYRWYGEMLGKVYYKTKILGEDFKPLQPKRLAKDKNNPKKIYITYHVPEPPLVLDEKTLKKETNFGFNIYKNNRVQSIAGVEIINDTTVAITSFSDLSDGKIAVAYGGASTRGHGNLRDSDPYQSFFNYENPDQKDNEGNFVFDHGSKASLVPPSGEPKGNDGKVIYGKPYPLYNFSVAFYYEVTDVDDSPETDPDPEDVTVPGTTRADLEAALNKAQPGDVILISESITLDDVFQCNKKVTFRGVGEDIRIDGGDLTKLLELNSSEGDAAFSMVFENLTFTGGNNEEDGGVGRIIGNGPVEFRNCIIENNYSANRGGAFFLDGSPEVSFVNCKINNNQSNGQGGAFFVAGNSVLNITDCEISGNNSFGERGGAFFLAGNSKTQILRTSIANNSNGDPQNPLDLGGGAFMMYNTPTLTVTSSSVIDNFCNGGHGSVMFSAGESNITFINTTIAGNKITTMASASFFLNGKTDLTFVNVTMAGNHSQTNNAGNSTGINILNAESKIRIYNSLLVGNTNPQGAVDITIFIPEVANAIGNILDVKNSIIGHIYGLTADQLATILPDDKDGLNASKINAYELTPNWQSSDVSGISL